MNRFAIVLIAVVFCTIGCAGGPALETPAAPEQSSYRPPQQSSQQAALPSESDRMVVSTATIDLKTSNPDSVQIELIAQAYGYGGYVLQTKNSLTSIRVPSQHLTELLATIDSMGDVLERVITGDDVTEEYVDLQTRLDNLEATRERYLMLLNQATALDDILRMEKELMQLTQRIESLKAKIERLSHLVAYSTVTVKTVLDEDPPALGPVSWVGAQVYRGVKWLFVRD